MTNILLLQNLQKLMINCQVLAGKLLKKDTKHLVAGNQLKKLETFDSIYFRGKSHFEDDVTQNYLVFQTVSKYFKTVSANDSNILNLKDCLMKVLSLPLRPIKCLILQ